MKRLLLGLMLLATATAASAEWTRVDSNDELIAYVDRATIRRNGNLVKMWDLKDNKTVEKSAAAGGGFSFSSLPPSEKAQQEYDCKEEKSRTLAFTWFGGQMGSGKVVFTDSDPGKWRPIEPGTIGATVWKIACGKK